MAGGCGAAHKVARAEPCFWSIFLVSPCIQMPMVVACFSAGFSKVLRSSMQCRRVMSCKLDIMLHGLLAECCLLLFAAASLPPQASATMWMCAPRLSPW